MTGPSETVHRRDAPTSDSTVRGERFSVHRSDLRASGPAYWVAVAVLALAALVGAAALAALVGSGAEPRQKWTYTAATLAFLLSTVQAAPIIAFATRLARGYWATPLRRVAELLGAGGLVAVPLLLALLPQLPDFQGRPSLWHNWPGSPWLWDSIAVVALALFGLTLIWASSLPDIAAERTSGRAGERASEPGRLTGWIGRAWNGTTRQWRALERALIALGGLYLMVYTLVHLLVSSDFALSLVPGWASSSVPAYHAISGLQAGLATALLALLAVRRAFGLQAVIRADVYHSAAKILLALALLWFYFVWAEFLTYWYGATREEVELLTLLMFGPYLVPFVLSTLLNFTLPLALLIWNPIRASIAGTSVVAALVVVGNFVDRVRMYGAAWSTAGPVEVALMEFPTFQWPGLLDGLIVLGALAGATLLFLLALRLVPALSLWEVEADRRLRREREYAQTTVPVVAKPS